MSPVKFHHKYDHEIKFQYDDMLKKKESKVVSSPPKDLYFMKSISNGTVAMMHAVANNKAK